MSRDRRVAGFSGLTCYSSASTREEVTEKKSSAVFFSASSRSCASKAEDYRARTDRWQHVSRAPHRP